MSSVPVTSDTEASRALGNTRTQGEVRSPSHTPPSSPPVRIKPEESETIMSPISRKRSHEDMNAESEILQAPAKHEDLTASQVKASESQTDNAATTVPDASALTMPAPPTPSVTMAPPATMTPRSGQGSQKQQASVQPPPTQPEKAPNSTDTLQSSEHDDSDITIPDDVASDDSGTPAEPHEKIVDFDWRNLEERYHATMGELKRDEDGIWDEFNQLCSFFGVWASTSQTHEVDRSFKRLKTQTTFVQHQEDELEQKRAHYIKVVDAFKSALDLLRT